MLTARRRHLRRELPSPPGGVSRLEASTGYAALAIRSIVPALLSALILWIFLDVSDVGKNPKATVVAMVDGSAWRPYVFRALVPTIVRALLALTPTGVEGVLTAAIERSEPAVALLREMDVPAKYYLKGLYCIVVMYGSFVGYAFTFGALFVAVRGEGRRADRARLWGPCCAVPLFGFGYIYDFTTLLLSTCLWLSLVRQRWWSFALVYLVSSINKETTILLSLAFAATQYGRLPAATFWRLLGFQLVVFIAVRTVLAHVYGGNPGAAFEWHLWDHWQAMRRPGEALLPAVAILSIAGLVAAGWSQKPVVLRRSLMATLPALVVLFLLFGYPFEWRVFYEVMPLIALLSLPVSDQPSLMAQT